MKTRIILLLTDGHDGNILWPMVKIIKFVDRGPEGKLLTKLKKLTDWNASQIIREALKMFAQAKGVQ